MGLFDELKKRGLWDGYTRHVVMLEPVLRRMGERGIPVNPEEYAKTEAILRGDMDKHFSEMQRLVPIEQLPHQPKEGFKREPKDKTGMVLLENGRWARTKEWKPSSKNLIRYMVSKRHPVPRDMKKDKDTTNQLELKRLHKRTGDALYGTVLNYRKAATVLTNHMQNWKPEADGRVHPTFYFDPATGQLSSRRPNAQNAPHHDDPEYGAGYAKQFRSMIKARPHHKIVEFDFSGFHVQTLAFEAEDKDLMRIGAIDLHSFVTSEFLHQKRAAELFAMKDDELADYLAWIKKNYKHQRNSQVKHAILGYNNGMGANKLYRTYQEYFSGLKEAKMVVSLMDSLFPKAKRYRDAICQKAHEQGYLISRHGYIRYFWEVFRWQGGEWSHGDDHEAALCFYTQNDAHGEIKERILLLEEMGLNEKYNFINTIHDSLKFEVHDDLLEECVPTVKAIMEAPSKVLINSICPDGLAVKVEAKAGNDWANCKVIG